MARVTVNMYATIREAAGVQSIELDATDLNSLFLRLRDRFGPPISTILERAKSDPETLVILLNGQNIGPRRSRSMRFSDGDEVAIFPPVSGG